MGQIVGRWILGRRIVVAFAVLSLSSCDNPAPSEAPTDFPTPMASIPGPSVLTLVGVVAEERSVDQRTTFELVDGGEATIDFSRDRVVARTGGSPEVLVLGQDDVGPWAAVLGHQEGTPPDCHVLRDTGFELIDSIVVNGIRWMKAPGLGVEVPLPSAAHPYPDGTRFCVDERGLVSWVLRP